MHDRISVSSICFMQKNLKEQAEYWRKLAPRRVSLIGPHIDAEGVAAAHNALASGNYMLETIMHPFLPGRRLDDGGGWHQPRANLSAQIAAATELGAQSIYMTSGGHGALTWEQAAECFAEAIAPCVVQAKAAGITLMIENAPPQYADLHIAHTLRDTITLAELAGISVCIDLFGCWTEADLKTSISRAVPRCSLVQVSDNICGDRSLPARAVPGDGDMPMLRLLEWILEAGYQGVFDLELLGPRIDKEGALQATLRAGIETGKLLRELGV